MGSKRYTVGLLATLLLTAGGWAQELTYQHLEKHLGRAFDDAVRQQLEPILRDFNTLEGNRSLAMAVDADGDVSVGYAFSASEAVASKQALAQCDAQRSEHIDVQAACEIVHLNHQMVPTAAQLKAPYGADDPSFVWRVQGKQATIYLGGTIHLMKPALYPLNQALRSAYRASQQLAVEVNILAPDADDTAAVARLVTADPALVRAAYSERLMAHIAHFAASNGVPVDALLGMQPNILSANVAVAQMAALGYDPAAGIDRHFLLRAASDNKPVIELESATQQLTLLTSLPLGAQAKLLEQTFDDLDDASAFLTEAVGSWLAGDAQAMFESTAEDFDDPALAEFGRRMLDERNAAMATKIIELIHGDRDTLVLVGAAHFGGPQGILALLQQAGWKTEQLPRG
jgi:uncharacterized protein YbaP (TraB family)